MIFQRATGNRTVTAFIFLSPALFLTLVFFIYPLTRVLVISFQEWQVLGTSAFVGFQNYADAFASEQFWQTLWNTTIYTIIVTPLIFFPALALALLLKTTTLSSQILRTMYFIPVTISFVAAAFIWDWIYHDSYGLLNYALLEAGLIDGRVNWLGSTWNARILVSLMIAWKTQGLSMMILLAGLQSIPNEVYEASRVDGANRSRTFFHITLPLLRPTLLLALILSVSGSFKAFDHFYIMTGGGPRRTTQTMVMYINKLAFEQFHMGLGSAVSVVFLIILGFLSYQQLKIGGYFND